MSRIAEPARSTRKTTAWPWGTGTIALLAALSLFGCGMAYVNEEPIEKATGFTGFVGRLVDSETGDGVGNAKITIRPTDEPLGGKPFYIYSLSDGSFQLRSYKRQGVSTPFKVGEEFQLVFSSPEHRIKEFTATFEGGEQKLGAIELLPVEQGGDVQVVIAGRADDQERVELPAPPRSGPPIP